MEPREGGETGDRRKRTARLRVGGDSCGGGGGGSGGVRIEGVLVWGGTLAIASLMALFTIRAKKKVSSRCARGSEKLKVKATEEEEEDGEGEGSGGLRVVLRDQSSPTSPLTPRNSSCCIGGSHGGPSRTDLDCSDSASGLSSTSEEKPAIEKGEENEPLREAVLSDGAKTESVTSFSDHSMVEDGSPPAREATDDWNENTENHLEKQMIHASSAFDRVARQELITEEDELVDSVEEEEEDGGGDEQEEEVEGSSEESGDSCLELNDEAIWPLEMIDEEVKTITEDRVGMTKINKQEKDIRICEEGEEDNVGDDTGKNHGDPAALAENKLEKPVVANRWTTHFPRPPIWIWCLLLLLMLLSFLVHSTSIRSLASDRCDLAVK